jgi:hypothetical protein
MSHEYAIAASASRPHLAFARRLLSGAGISAGRRTDFSSGLIRAQDR